MLRYLWLCHTHRKARSPADHALCHGLSRAVNHIMRHLNRTLTLVSLGCAVSTFTAFYSCKLYKKHFIVLLQSARTIYENYFLHETIWFYKTILHSLIR